MNDEARYRFPGVEGRVYLNSCSVGLPPRTTDDVYARWQSAMARFEDDAFGELYAELLSFRERLGAFMGADPDGLWFGQNSSDLLARIVLGLRRDRTRVVTTDLEFPSAEMMFGSLPGIELAVVPSTQGVVDGQRVADAIDDRTWMVFASHATTSTGAILDVSPVVEAARRRGAWVGLDVYQSVGCFPVDLATLDVDFVVGGGHKWLLGAWDLGYAWLSSRALDAFRPVAVGWMAGADPFTFAPQRALAPDARRLAIGTPDPLGSMLGHVGLDEHERVGMAEVRRRSVALTRRVLEGTERWGALTPREDARRGGTVCLAVPEADRVRAELLARDIVVSARALPGGRRGLRVAPHFYNDTDDIDAFLDALGAVA